MHDYIKPCSRFYMRGTAINLQIVCSGYGMDKTKSNDTSCLIEEKVQEHLI